MEGRTSTQKIRECNRKDAQVILIFAMTADVFSEGVQEFASVGMDGYIAKPIDTEILLRMLSSREQRK